MKKKLGRPPKKKVIETFDEEEPKGFSETTSIESEKKCDCGRSVTPGHNQCYSCSHRS